MRTALLAAAAAAGSSLVSAWQVTWAPGDCNKGGTYFQSGPEVPHGQATVCFDIGFDATWVNFDDSENRLLGFKSQDSCTGKAGNNPNVGDMTMEAGDTGTRCDVVANYSPFTDSVRYYRIVDADWDPGQCHGC